VAEMLFNSALTAVTKQNLVGEQSMACSASASL